MKKWDIFCNVVDNYGDIGVSWRLARQLANEFGQKVRLWVDDLESFRRINPDAADRDYSKGVEVRHWGKSFPEVEPADIVIEAFGCRLPENFVERMKEKKPVWINLEYLSAEDWVEDCHLLPSPRPPLVKYFFFPGFSKDTGGLILEKDLFERRGNFRKKIFWENLGLDPGDRLCISLFCYENPPIGNLFEAWEKGEREILCLVPEGKIASKTGSFSRGNLEVRIIPFVPQEEYDPLLWACDINFVRGEDSFVRGQWALKPFVWQIYPQEDETHFRKLNAFLDLYCRDLMVSDAVRAMWLAWNGKGDVALAWKAFLNAVPLLEAHGKHWADRLSGNNLVKNLVDFSNRKS